MKNIADKKLVLISFPAEPLEIENYIIPTYIDQNKLISKVQGDVMLGLILLLTELYIYDNKKLDLDTYLVKYLDILRSIDCSIIIGRRAKNLGQNKRMPSKNYRKRQKENKEGRNFGCTIFSGF